jgi:hypothetical protein
VWGANAVNGVINIKPIRPQELDDLLEIYVERRRKAAEEPERILSKKD